MAFSNWLCNNSTKNMLVKIVHPGGHVELHDRPVLAAEIMLRNPKCCVAHPHIFQQPWAIVTPDTKLLPGQKFFVVPMGTIRKLQKRSLHNSPASSRVEETLTSPNRNEEGEGNGKSSNCWLFGNNKSKRKKMIMKEMKRDGKFDDDDNDDEDGESCFACLLGVVKIKGKNEEETTSSVNGGSETVGLTRTRIGGGGGGFVQRRLSCDHWQPNLESVCEVSSLKSSICED